MHLRPGSPRPGQPSSAADQGGRPVQRATTRRSHTGAARRRSCCPSLPHPPAGRQALHLHRQQPVLQVLLPQRPMAPCAQSAAPLSHRLSVRSRRLHARNGLCMARNRLLEPCHSALRSSSGCRNGPASHHSPRRTRRRWRPAPACGPSRRRRPPAAGPLAPSQAWARRRSAPCPCPADHTCGSRRSRTQRLQGCLRGAASVAGCMALDRGGRRNGAAFHGGTMGDE
jgi:hypothetical protein